MPRHKSRGPKKLRVPPGPERSDLHFDRSQFEGSITAMEDRYLAAIDGLRISASERQRIDESPLDWEYLRGEITKHGGLPVSPLVADAMNRAENWASHATWRNILSLPRKLALALIWRYWGQLTFDQIASTLGYRSRCGAFAAVAKAKERLLLLPSAELEEKLHAGGTTWTATN